MSTPTMAVGAAALGFFVYVRRWQRGGFELAPPSETHARTETAPATWAETVYLFREALRYVYQETLGRWRAVDLFFGLAYIARRDAGRGDGLHHPAADIAAAAGAPVCRGLSDADAAALAAELRTLRRLMLYCQGLRHHGAEAQRKHWETLIGTRAEDVLHHSPTAGVLRPAYAVVHDREARAVILVIRGTHSRQDMFTSLIGAVKPHHVVAPEGVVLGYAHLGMLAAARWVLKETKYRLARALAAHPGHQLLIVGHSMGGGTAALLTMMARERVPELAGARCYAFACPAVATRELAAACGAAVTTLVHGADIVPSFSSGSVDDLREEVARSAWFADFQRDTRQRLYASLTAAVAGATAAGGAGLAAGCSGAGQWAAANVLAPASRPFRSCYDAAGAGRRRGQALSSAKQQQQRRVPGALAGYDGRDAAAAGEDAPLLVGGGGDGGGGDGGAGNAVDLLPSASMLEDALQQCIAAAEAGDLGAANGGGVLAAPPATEAFDRGGGGGGGVVGGVRAALGGGGKRPGGPADGGVSKKKDDGEGEGADGPSDGADAAGTGAAGASAATLRRRGWTWQVLGGGGGDGSGGAGGADGSGGSSWALDGGGVGGAMVAYAGRTGRFVGAAAGSLLRGGGAMMFQACTAPRPGGPRLAAGGGGAAAGGAHGNGGIAWLADLPAAGPLVRLATGVSLPESRRAPDAGGASGGRAPGDDGESSEDPDLDPEVPLLGAGGTSRGRSRGGGRGGGGGSGSGDEDDDGDADADARELERPAVRESISAVVATVVTSDTDAGAAAAAAEASAAEELLLRAADDDEGTGGAAVAAGGDPAAAAAAAAATRLPVSKAARASAAAAADAEAARSGSDSSGSGSGSGGGGARRRAAGDAPNGGAGDAAARDERMRRRKMYPLGRILHLMPASVVDAAQGSGAHPAADGHSAGGAPQGHSHGGAGGAAEGGYVLLELTERREVYGRLRLCRAMVRDHFLPGYLRAADSVAARLEAQAGDGGGAV